VRFLCGAAALVACFASAAAAQSTYAKTTYLTFSGPVSLPNMTLPAGTYTFQLADPDTSRKVIMVKDKESGKPYGLFLTIPNQKMEPSDKPTVMFAETPKGMAPAVRAWFYPGERTGYEFIFPRSQAMKIAKASHQPVLTAENASGSNQKAI